MKKALNIILILVFLVSIVSFSANAALSDVFRAGLTPIENFFSGGLQNYEKTITFLVFFVLFFSAFIIGMRNSKALGEVTRAHKTFAFAAAFLSSLIIVFTMRFDWINLKYIAWFLIGVITLYGLYLLLSKLGLGNKKILALIIALILTLLLLWLIWSLMQDGRALDGLGRVSDWFGGLGKGVKSTGSGVGNWFSRLGDKIKGVKGISGIDLGSKAGGINDLDVPAKDPLRDLPPIESGESVPVKKARSKLLFWVLIPVLIALGGASWYGSKLLKKDRGEGGGEGGGDGDGGDSEDEREETLREAIREALEQVKAKKIEIWGKIGWVMGKIDGNEKKIVKIYKRHLSKIKERDRVPWLRSEGSPEWKAIKMDKHNVKDIINEQGKLKRLLIELSQLEKALLGKIGGWRNEVISVDRRTYNRLLDDLDATIKEVFRLILIYYHAEESEEEIAIKLNQLFDKSYLEDRIKDKWMELVKEGIRGLVHHFGIEIIDLKSLKLGIELENSTIDELLKLLKVKVTITQPAEDTVYVGKPFNVYAQIDDVDYNWVKWGIQVGPDGHNWEILLEGVSESGEVIFTKDMKDRLKPEDHEGNAILFVDLHKRDGTGGDIRVALAEKKIKIKELGATITSPANDTYEYRIGGTIPLKVVPEGFEPDEVVWGIYKGNLPLQKIGDQVEMRESEVLKRTLPVNESLRLYAILKKESKRIAAPSVKITLLEQEPDSGFILSKARVDNNHKFQTDRKQILTFKVENGKFNKNNPIITITSSLTKEGETPIVLINSSTIQNENEIVVTNSLPDGVTLDKGDYKFDIKIDVRDEDLERRENG